CARDPHSAWSFLGGLDSW
nr:immunoglobulin heavy chain junction region [Macaca mulatta]MOV53984.1 immunoglobulin heavy chain junction region [Macaca mulatta]MOV57864.1 immunoglobulin heavy chain junction region [Macaca mulatta]